MGVGALWGAILVLSIWCLTTTSLSGNNPLPVLSVFGLIFCGVSLFIFLLKFVIENWDKSDIT